MESEGKRRTIRITVWVAVLGLLLGVLSSIISAVAADAHAALKSINPADGGTVATAPRQVTLEFNEPIGASFATVTVTGPSGDAGEGRPQVDGRTVTQPLADSLPDGKYSVSFRVVSEDGHPVSDTTTFTITGASATSSSEPVPEPTTTSGANTTTASPSTSSTSESPATATTSADDGGQTLRLGLAVGVGALAVAAGTALVAASRRRGRS
ncbi:copper resistance CopC family protein [Pedococcus aerophilus]